MQLNGLAFSRLGTDDIPEQESKSDFLILGSLANTAKKNQICSLIG